MRYIRKVTNIHIWWNISLYMDFIWIQIRAMREYPGAFLLKSFAKLVGVSASICTTYLMIYRFGSVLNWSTYEVMLLYSMNVVGYALAGFFMFHPFKNLSQRILDGTFDEMLTKPLNPFFYLCSRDFSTGYFSNLCAGTALLATCFIKLNIEFNPVKLVYLFIVLMGAGMIHSGFFMFINIPSFWIQKVEAISQLRSTLDSFIRYPISIYDTWIQVMLTFIFPFAFVNFFPAQYFLGKDDFSIFSPWFTYMTPGVGLVMVILGYLFFFLGLRNYKSTGS